VQRWEYIQMMLDGGKVLVEDAAGTLKSEGSFVAKMNDLGRDGWELMAVYKIGERPIYVFKRPRFCD
jgi:hypothetical protein